MLVTIRMLDNQELRACVSWDHLRVSNVSHDSTRVCTMYAGPMAGAHFIPSSDPTSTPFYIVVNNLDLVELPVRRA